jgi:hypothetical protein
MAKMTIGSTFAAGAALVIGLALAPAGFAQDPPSGGGGAHGGGGGGHVGSSFGGSFHGAMPSAGFHGVPDGFHGALPRATPGAAPFHAAPGGPGHDLGTFHGHDFMHLTAEQRTAWQHGGWRHSWHNGHWGWWWVAGGLWFYYPEPIYPYPDYIGTDYYYDYYDEYGTPGYYWYYCENPQGYYPYVQQCNGPWEPVPPTYAP